MAAQNSESSTGALTDCSDISLQELLTILHRNDVVSPELVTTISRHASLLGTSIINDYKTLNGILLRFEGLIRKRWWKKTVAQRQDVLLQVWPNMPVRHRADYFECTCHFKESLSNSNQPVIPSDTRMWPYINLEDLTKPQSLPVFLNSRGRNVPMEFSPSDATFSPLSEMSPCVVEPELQKYWLHFGKGLDPSTYGQTVLDKKDGTDYKRSGQGYYFCMRPSLQILHIQARIMSFLVGCSKAILHDITESELLGSPVMSEPPCEDLHQHEVSGHLAFSDAVVMAPYRKRDSVDFGRLQGYIGSLLTNAKDHLLALREDPSYFSDEIHDRIEHDIEMIPDVAGRTSNLVDRPIYIDYIVGGIVKEAYMMLGLWHELASILERLAQVGENDTDENHSFLMDELECKLRVACFILTSITYTSAKATPTLRRLLVRQAPSREEGTRTEIITNSNIPPSEEEAFLLRTFDCLDPEAKCPIKDTRLFHLLDTMDVMFRCNKNVKALLSPTLTKLMTAISLVAECIMQVSVWKDTALARGVYLESDHNHDKSFMEWMNPLVIHRLPGGLVNPARGRLRYPVHKARTHGNVGIMRASEKNLDRLWEVVDQVLLEKSGLARHDYIRQCLEEAGPPRRTPEWVELTKAKEMVGTEKAREIYQSLSQAHHDKSMQITGVFDKLSIEAKPKPKTKGVATSIIHGGPVDDVSDVEIPIESQKHIALDKRAYKAMKALFHVVISDADEVPKSLKWNEFTRAMVRAGFSAEKLQGSAWQFTPSASLDVERGIQFHEPHPDSDIPHIMARRFGRRLERVYGWTGETFRLA
ncbi:hypothetical protein NX059_002041 [Plenodomus lindquistii]|nr:hypothetical protein NX059_002041 [Plenodomus lindquistii]